MYAVKFLKASLSDRKMIHASKSLRVRRQIKCKQDNALKGTAHGDYT